jgi:hypothetical protein
MGEGMGEWVQKQVYFVGYSELLRVYVGEWVSAWVCECVGVWVCG